LCLYIWYNQSVLVAVRYTGRPLTQSDYTRSCIKSSKAELNPICHLLVLLGDLTFMGPCILSIFQYTCISNKMQRYTVYLYQETALHVSGGKSTHHQEHIQLYLQLLVFVTPVLLSAAIVEELESTHIFVHSSLSS
jgi:hypothetical protein